MPNGIPLTIGGDSKGKIPAGGTANQYLVKTNNQDYNAKWETMDATPTASSEKAVTSGGVKTALNGKQDATNYSAAQVNQYLAMVAANPNAAGFAVANAAIEATDYPGCWYRMTNGVKEWLNPPLIDGVEYRTTERFLGKPVYQKLITAEVPENTTGLFQVLHGISNVSRAVSISPSFSPGVGAQATMIQTIPCLLLVNSVQYPDAYCYLDIFRIEANFIKSYPYALILNALIKVTKTTD